MEQIEVTQNIEQLQLQLQQRANQLMSQDPSSQRLMGQIEAYKSMTPLVSENGELVEETE